jgi:hypothetical protein
VNEVLPDNFEIQPLNDCVICMNEGIETPLFFPCGELNAYSPKVERSLWMRFQQTETEGMPLHLRLCTLHILEQFLASFQSEKE